MPCQRIKSKTKIFLAINSSRKLEKKNTKPSRDIVQKLEEISGIRERRYIREDEESIDILPGGFPKSTG